MIDIFDDEIDKEKYIVCTYIMKSKTTLSEAAWNLAVGQSIGNPSIRNKWETDELLHAHACFILSDMEYLVNNTFGEVKIAFPIKNIDIKTDGISQLLCHVMGGQVDIDIIEECSLIDIEFPNEILSAFSGPRYGLAGMRKYTNTYNKPLLGAIIKPKVGLSQHDLLEIVMELVDGGVNFIKEDEILSSPLYCPLEQRISKIGKYVQDNNVIYSACINSDPAYILDRARAVYNAGGNGVHINVWSGLGAYKSVRELNLPLFIHFQRSGDRVFTNSSNSFSISWSVICYLAGLMGVDSIHAGMSGGYMTQDKDNSLSDIMDILDINNVTPALSCGMHPGLVESIRAEYGNDWMANVGGAIHGHPSGTRAGALAMRQAIDKTGGAEYEAAILKWGLVK